ncbi:MAG: HesA/MoeB/ThiF family protein [Spirochaetota bacterium]
MLTGRERQRYHRQILIPGWGEGAQANLKAARVFIAGAGGLGSPAAFYLAAAGVGTIRICDAGTVEPSNLNRQILHGDEDVGVNKALSAARSLCRINPLVRVVPLQEEITEQTVERLAGDAQILVDCLDNIPARMVLNSLAVRRNMPLVHAGVSGLCGQITVVRPPRTPCLGCFLPRGGEEGVFPILGATAAVLGSLEALETLRYLTGRGDPLEGRLLYVDLEELEFHWIDLQRDPGCPACGDLNGGGAAPGAMRRPGQRNGEERT